MKKLLLFLLLIPFLGLSQTVVYTLTPTGKGTSITSLTALTNTGTTETNLISGGDVILANTLVTNRNYHFRLLCRITTPALSIPTITVKVKLGASSISLTTNAGISAGLTNQPFTIEGDILADGVNTQIIHAWITQNVTSVFSLNTGNTAMVTNWAEDMTTDKTFNISVTWGGITVGTTSLTPLWFRRSDF